MSSSGRLSWAPSLICSSLDPTYGGTNSLARSPVFEAWRVAAKIHLVAPTTLQKRGFDRLSAFNLPRAILQSGEAQQRNTHRLQDTFFEGLSSWARSHQTQMSDVDVHNMASLAQTLYVSFSRLVDSVDTNAVELTQRRAIDDIVDLAFKGRMGSIHSVVQEGRLRLRATEANIVMGVTAAADSLAFVPFPPDLWQGILEGEDNENHVLDRAFWSAECDSTPTLLRFCGEFKRGAGNRNRNQLMIDMVTFQSQQRALGMNEILWGATCAAGRFELFSSCRAPKNIYISSHGILNLTDPVNFLRCYSFLANLALDTEPFLEKLQSRSAASIFESMRATTWRTSITPDPETRSAVDVGMSSKRRKSDSHNDGGEGGEVAPKRPKRKQKDAGMASGGAKDRSGGSGTRQDSKGKSRARAGVCGGDEAKDRMESLDSALDNNLGSPASVGSATFCEGRRIEARMSRQSTSCSLNRSLLEAHAVLSRPATPPFHEIEKWRSSISI